MVLKACSWHVACPRVPTPGQVEALHQAWAPASKRSVPSAPHSLGLEKGPLPAHKYPRAPKSLLKAILIKL